MPCTADAMGHGPGALIEIQRAAAANVAAVLGGHSLAERRRTPDVPASTTAHRGALLDLTQGTLRHLGTLRAILGMLAERGVSDPAIESLLLVALYQLLHTKAAPHAIVNHAVGATRAGGAGGAAGFVNAALRRFLRERDELLVRAARTPVGRWSHPAWWIQRLREQYSSAAEQILEQGLAHPPMSLRVNPRRIDAARYQDLLRAAGIDAWTQAHGAITLRRPVPAASLPGFAEGLVSVQDAGAQYAARLLDLADGQRVLDACAAPGGKTAHILESADVSMTALDRDGSRLADARRNLDRLGLEARTIVADAAEVSTWWNGVLFDRILLDAPCTASGIVRRHPDAKWLRREADIASFALTQQRLLAALWQAVVPGGKLLYVTCSVFAEENRDTLATFVAGHADAIELAAPGLPAASGQLLPSREHDGFFYALLQKAEG